MPGKVYLVGAGPGDPELLTLKAHRLIKSADVILHDALVAPEILKLATPTATVRNVGKRSGRKSTQQQEINRLLISYAKFDLQVVRLKGGDPLIFGRCGEEIEALLHAKIDFEIVPGITAALGAAASTKIPLTHRDVSSALLILTSHRSDVSDDGGWPMPLPKNATIVVYMPGNDYRALAHKLLRGGLEEPTPCALISQATSSEESVHVTTIKNLFTAPQLVAPNLLVVGEVVALADQKPFRDLAKAEWGSKHEFVAAMVQSEFFAASREAVGDGTSVNQEQPD
jgi:uroporphyrin-III C-methyltransferase